MATANITELMTQEPNLKWPFEVSTEYLREHMEELVELTISSLTSQ